MVVILGPPGPLSSSIQQMDEVCSDLHHTKRLAAPRIVFADVVYLFLTVSKPNISASARLISKRNEPSQ